MFEKIARNTCKFIPDEQAKLSSMCEEYELDENKVEQELKQGGEFVYSWLRVKSNQGSVDRREMHYLFHTMKKRGELKRIRVESLEAV